MRPASKRKAPAAVTTGSPSTLAMSPHKPVELQRQYHVATVRDGFDGSIIVEVEPNSRSWPAQRFDDPADALAHADRLAKAAGMRVIDRRAA